MPLHALYPFGIEQTGPHDAAHLISQIAYLHLFGFARVSVIGFNLPSPEVRRRGRHAAVRPIVAAAVEQIVLVADHLVVGNIHCGEAGLQRPRAFDPERVLAVGVPVPMEKNIREIGLRLPCGRVDGEIDPGLIGSRLRRKKPEGRGTPRIGIISFDSRQTFLRMFADKVAFQRFIQRGDGLYRRIQHVHGRRETVPKQTRYADGHVNTRAAQLFQRDDVEPFHHPVAQPTRNHSEKIEELPHPLAVGPHHVVAHPEHGDVLGVAPLFLQMFGDKRAGEVLPYAPRRTGRQASGIKRIEIPASRQNVFTPPRNDAGRPRQHIVAREGAQQRTRLVRGLHPFDDAENPPPHRNKAPQRVRHETRIPQQRADTCGESLRIRTLHQYFTYGNKLFFHLFQQAGMTLPKAFVHSSRFSK